MTDSSSGRGPTPCSGSCALNLSSLWSQPPAQRHWRFYLWASGQASLRWAVGSVVTHGPL